MINWNKTYLALTKAQDKCYDAKEDQLFDMCQYHINIVGDEELTSVDNEQILQFAKDVFKIATLRYNLDPIV